MEDDDVSDNDDSKRLKTDDDNDNYNEGRMMMIGSIMVVKEGEDSGNDNGG